MLLPAFITTQTVDAITVGKRSLHIDVDLLHLYLQKLYNLNVQLQWKLLNHKNTVYRLYNLNKVPVHLLLFF